MSSLPPCSSYNIDTAAQQVRIKYQVHTFCEKTGFWASVKQSCTSYLRRHKSSSFEPLLLSLSFNFADIEDADLIYLITKEPKQFESIVEELICTFAQDTFADSGSQLRIVAEQIHCSIVVLDLPLIPTFIFTFKTVHLNCALTTFRCIASSSAGPFQYIRQSLWKCKSCIGLNHVVHKNRKNTRKTVNCQSCLKECEEIEGQQVKSKFCIARVFQAEHFKAERSQFATAFTIELRIYDEQCQELKLGAEYIVTGIFQPYPNFYDVWSISPAL